MSAFESLTPEQVRVLHDMYEEWSDRDRHGQLDYSEDELSAFYALSEMVTAEARKRRIIYV